MFDLKIIFITFNTSNKNLREKSVLRKIYSPKKVKVCLIHTSEQWNK